MNTYTIIIFMIISTFFGAYGSLYFKRGSHKTNNKLISFIFNINLIIGGGLYIVSTMIYIYLLSKTNLSLLYPISALTYIWVLALSKIHLKEKISTYKVISIIFIITGILLVIL